MANPGPDADSTVLAIGQADGLAVRDARPVPVPPSSSLAHKQGLRAPVRQCKARFTSSLSMTDGYWLLITLATKTFRIESPCIQRQDGTSVSDCLQELLAAGYSLLIASSCLKAGKSPTSRKGAEWFPLPETGHHPSLHFPLLLLTTSTSLSKHQLLLQESKMVSNLPRTMRHLEAVLMVIRPPGKGVGEQGKQDPPLRNEECNVKEKAEHPVNKRQHLDHSPSWSMANQLVGSPYTSFPLLNCIDPFYLGSG